MTNALIVFVALEHVWFFVLESFLWTRPLGLRVFRQTPDQARASAALAANQGVYNGFLAAGLLWSVFAPPELAPALKVFFLSCVIVAGVVGAATVSYRILFIQALPAAVALSAVLFAS